MRKLWKAFGGIVPSALLTGCALFDPLASFDETAVVIEKNGAIRELVVESFSEASYSEDEFESFIHTQEESYNAYDEDGVTIDSVRLKDGELRMKAAYADDSAYSAFNGIVFEITDFDAWEGKDTLPEAVLAQMTGSPKYVLTTNGSFIVRVPEKIWYAQEDVTVTDEKTAKTSGSDSVIIYE